MLSHVLQVDVSQHTSRALLDNVNAFKGTSSSFLESLAVLLVEKTMPPSTFLFRENDPSKALYFVARGVVEALAVNADTLATDPKIDRVYADDSVLGEVPFFFSIRQLFSARTRVNQLVRIYELSVRDYKRFLEAYPDEERAIFQNIINIDIGSVKPASGLEDKESSSAGFEGRNANEPDEMVPEFDEAADANGSESSSFASQMLDKVAQAIENGRRVKDVEEVRTICSAASKGRLEDLERLTRRRAGAGDTGSMSLQEAVTCTDVRARTPLHLAVSHNHHDATEWLIEAGADINALDHEGRTPMSDAIQNKHDQVAALLRSHGCRIDSGDAAGWMCTAGANGDLDQLRRLISNHCNPNEADYDARTALHLAASNGHFDCVKFLISSWADPNPVDRWGGTPLSDAIRHNHSDIQQFLVEEGGEIGATDLGGVLCQHAVDDEVDQLRVLVKNGASINVGDYDDRTVSSSCLSSVLIHCEAFALIIRCCLPLDNHQAVHLAASCAQLGVLHALASFSDIDINPVDRYGGTPTEDAVREGHYAVEQFLVARGGLRKDAPELIQKRAERDTRQAIRLQEAQQTQHKNEQRDAGREALSKQMEGYLKCVDGPLIKLHTLTQILAMTLDPNGASAPRALTHSPKPSLTELLELRIFQAVFYNFAKSVHSESLLEFYIEAQKVCGGDARNRVMKRPGAKSGPRAGRAGSADQGSVVSSSNGSGDHERGSSENEPADPRYSSPTTEGLSKAQKQWRMVEYLYKRFLRSDSQQSINANPRETDRVRQWLKSSPEAHAMMLADTNANWDHLDDTISIASSKAGSGSSVSGPAYVRTPVKPFHEEHPVDDGSLASLDLAGIDVHGETVQLPPERSSASLVVAHQSVAELEGLGWPVLHSELSKLGLVNRGTAFQSARALAEQLAEARAKDKAPPSSDAAAPRGDAERSERASAEGKRSLLAVTQGQAFKNVMSASKKSGVISIWGATAVESLSAAQVVEPLHTWAGKRLEADVLRKFYRSSGYREMLKERTGRFWRILRLTELVSSHVSDVESDLLFPLEGTASQESMLLIYDQPARAHEMTKEVLALTSSLRETCLQMRSHALSTAHAAKRLFKKLELRDAMASLPDDSDEDEEAGPEGAA
jgi:ankyrin repeat protein